VLGNLFGSNYKDPADCKIFIDDEEIDDLYPYLSSLSIEVSRNMASEAQLEFQTRRDNDGRWIIQDDERLTTWKPIVIEAVFGQAGSEEIMRGFIRQISMRYPNSAGEAVVTVICQDDSLPLDRHHQPTTWGDEQPTSDGQILRDIIGRYAHLDVNNESADGLAEVVLHQSQRDSQFLLQRARINGYELIYSEGEVYFGPPRLDSEPQPSLMVYAGPDTNCSNFDINDDGQRPDRVSYETAAETGEENRSATLEPNLTLLGNEPANSNSSGLADFNWQMSVRGSHSDLQMAALAQARANEQAFRITAQGELDGSLYGHVLRVGETVGVDGIGEKYGGIYYVDNVSHRFDQQGYRQTFRLLRNAYGDNLEASVNPLAGLI
jgi:phage protein D